MWSDQNSGKSVGLIPGRETAGPLFLMATTPIFALLFWRINVTYGGDFMAVWQELSTNGLANLWATPDMDCVKLLAVFWTVQVLLQQFAPGPIVEGPVTPAGNVPKYRENGPLATAVAAALYLLGAYRWQLFAPGIAFEKMPELIVTLNYTALVFCAFLYVKGRVAPSSSDSGASGNLILDYYWGTELHPRIFGVDVKTFTNCRSGMGGWVILLLDQVAFAHRTTGTVSNALFVSVFLQLVYCAKFFHWEAGYWRSTDIDTDRAGFYICWGCLVWLPSIYPSPSAFLAGRQDVDLSATAALITAVCGWLCIYINYDADRQRAFVRAVRGRCKVWGAAPRLIRASYKTAAGDTHQSLILASGYWGVSRHFHYIPEILASLFWTVPFVSSPDANPARFFYVVYLTILLFDRSVRDDARCADKYKKHWDEYRALVPYRVIPGIF